MAVVFSGSAAFSTDSCIFQVSADDVEPNIMLLLDNGAEVENAAWHKNYDNDVIFTPNVDTDGVDNDGDTLFDEADGSEKIQWKDGSMTSGFTNDQGYSIVKSGGVYCLVKILADLIPDSNVNGYNSTATSVIDSVTWATFKINNREIKLPAVPSAVVDGDGVRDNATIFRYSKNYLNWIFYGAYAGDGSDLPDKSRFYYAKKAIFTVADLTRRQAYFGIYAFESSAKGASNVQPLAFVYDETGNVDPNFVNTINNLGTFNYSPLAEGLAQVGGYYASPKAGVDEAYCQKNFIIVVSSGLSSEDQAAAAGSQPKVLNDYDNDAALPEGTLVLTDGAASTTITIPKNINGSSYMDDVAYYLNTNDIIGYLPGFQNIYTYTIGFMGNTESNAYLINTSNNGNGNLNLYNTNHQDYGKYHFAAENPDDLSAQLLKAINAILSITSSFTAPVVPVTRTTSGNQIYLAFFKPLETNFWEGNVTKFALSNDAEILGADGKAATWPNGAMKEDAVPYWGTIDWADTTKSNGIKNTERNIYTYLGTDKNLANPGNQFTAANISPAMLTTYTDAAGPIKLKDILGEFQIGDIIIGAQSGAKAEITNISADKTLLTFDGKNAFNFRYGEKVSNGLVPGAVGEITSTGTSEVIQFIRGADVLDEDGDGNLTENRKLICGDPLHSEPVVINYGDTDNDPATPEQAMVFFGANDGMLHAVNDNDGTEAWSFIPPDLLPSLKNLIEASEHPYFVDSSPSILLRDYNKNGTIEPFATTINGVVYPADKVYLVCGERMGGTSYFALDITLPHSPKFLWRIAQTAGFPAADTVIPELGQTWSVPLFRQVKTTAKPAGVDVVFIAGGYSETNANGNTLLSIDADTGTIIKQFLDDADHADLNFSIPSKIFALDRDLNGFTDKLYVGDMGGQVWRIGNFTAGDFTTIDENIDNWEIYKLFQARCSESDCVDATDNDLDGQIDDQDTSKFYYPPTVTLEGNFDMVFIGSGDRNDPCNTIDYNALYAIKDEHSDLAVLNLELSDLANADTTSLGYSTPNLSGTDKGWYLMMPQGEKALAESVVFNKKLYATTFLPNNEPCVPGGFAKLYVLNYLTGKPELDLNGDGTVSQADAASVIGGGIPSKPVIVITSTNVAKLLISTSSTIPDPASEDTAAGVVEVDTEFPDVNFYLRWWRESIFE